MRKKKISKKKSSKKFNITGVAKLPGGSYALVSGSKLLSGRYKNLAGVKRKIRSLLK